MSGTRGLRKQPESIQAGRYRLYMYMYTYLHVWRNMVSYHTCREERSSMSSATARDGSHESRPASGCARRRRLRRIIYALIGGQRSRGVPAAKTGAACVHRAQSLQILAGRKNSAQFSCSDLFCCLLLSQLTRAVLLDTRCLVPHLL